MTRITSAAALSLSVLLALLLALLVALMLALPLAAASAGAAASSEPLLVRVWPAAAQAPATVRIDMQVQPDERNRSLVIVVDSGDYYRSSAIALDGERAARFHSVQYVSLPAGAYDIQVALVAATGKARATARVTVQIAP